MGGVSICKAKKKEYIGLRDDKRRWDFYFEILLLLQF